LSIAFSLLLICIVFASGTAIQDGAAAQSLIAVFTVAALASIGLSARTADVKFASQVTRGLKLIAAIPAVWMALQILPTPIGAHSIWSYANEALGRQALGHISVDLGVTIVSLIGYLANLALILVGIFVTADRRRAELVLFVLAGATAVTAILLVFAELGLFAAGSARDADRIQGAVSALAILASLACGVRALERHESRTPQGKTVAREVVFGSVAAMAGLACGTIGLALAGSLNNALVTIFGIALFASVQTVRRLGLGAWATATLGATLVLAAAMIIAWRYDPARAVSPFLQFANTFSAESLSTVQRMMTDAGWQGTGAGTFAAMASIYQDLAGAEIRPITTVSTLAIELGWPAVFFSVAAAGLLFVLLYRGSLRRGRDSFYPALAASCTFIVVAQAFCDASLLNSCIAIMVDAIVALGLAQSISRRDGL
jgi:hypothetical protein